MRRVRKPLIISPVPASNAGPVSRAMSVKRLARLRINWFVVGSVFGIALSFFMNFLITAVVIPGYEHFAKPGATDVALHEVDANKPIQPPVSPILAAAEKAAPEVKPVPEVTYPQKLALKLGRGQTLLDMLVAHRVPRAEATKVVNALKPTFNPQQLKAGQSITVTLARHETVGDGAAVRELAFRLPNLDTIALQRADSGSFNVAAKKEVLTTASHRAVGKVRTSLLQAAADGGIPSSAMHDILKAFSYDVDFQREIHPGDTIEVLMDRKTAKDGTVGGYGAVRYAKLTLRGEKHEIYRFKNSYGDDMWYDAQGNSVKKSLLRTPVNVAHITSGFGMRTHPLLGYNKMHKGVDFGGATGTPIMAAGDGIVEFKGWKSGYGNFVVIRHNKTYETAYGHMSKFGKISEGNRVKQGQVIGYVGMTGAATGPHLHYEVRANNQQVNPVSKQFNLANGLSGKQLASFNANKDTVQREMAALGGASAKTKATKLAKVEKPAKPAAKAKEKAKPQKLASR